jgi:hypothetical protein
MLLGFMIPRLTYTSKGFKDTDLFEGNLRHLSEDFLNRINVHNL